MKVYMLNPPFIPHFGRSMRWQDTGRAGALYYPIWLSYATAVVEQKYKVRLVDVPAWGWNLKDVLVDVKRFKPDLVVVDSSFPSLKNDIKVAEEIKAETKAKTILVGPPTSQFSDKILKNSDIDMVARYEYDFTIMDVAEVLEKGEDLRGIKGISYREDGKIIHNPNREFTNSEDLDRMPFVSKVYKEHLNVKDYFLNYCLYPMVQIFTGRGCPFQCTFCSWPQTFMGRKYRVRSIENILDELEWIEENLRVREVFFEDDTFTIDKKRVVSFCRKYRERGLKISWSCNARVDTLDLETMKEMKKANCRFLIVGFESADNEILKNIKKGFTVEKAKEFARNVKKAGLFLHADFIIGLPGETKETIEKTRRFIEEIKPEQLQVSVVSPFPGTELYEWYKRNGFLITEDPNEYLDEQGHQKSIVSYPWLSAEEIVEKVDGILRKHYLSPNYIPVILKQVFNKDGLSETIRLWNSAKTFLKYIKCRPLKANQLSKRFFIQNFAMRQKK
jgi:radical SAM superfamily enzyme YgiQ (UPF0313 family)